MVEADLAMMTRLVADRLARGGATFTRSTRA
jgi:hypothetical protein